MSPPPRETALSDDPAPTFQPDTFFATAKAAERYAAIADAGGWPTDVAPLQAGAKGPKVAELRQAPRRSRAISTRPQAEPAPKSGTTTSPQAVKHFQSRMGLRQSGDRRRRDR